MGDYIIIMYWQVKQRARYEVQGYLWALMSHLQQGCYQGTEGIRHIGQGVNIFCVHLATADTLPSSLSSCDTCALTVAVVWCLGGPKALI